MEIKIVKTKMPLLIHSAILNVDKKKNKNFLVRKKLFLILCKEFYFGTY
jgi:hypothetical protein